MEKLLAKVVEIVKSTTTLMMSTNKTIELKNGWTNIVTSADKAIQSYLCKQLSELLPNSSFICEEDGTYVHNGDEYTWIIDPIDGTTNFSRSISEYAISIALRKDNTNVLGVVYNPAKDELYTAIKGQNAYKNGKLINVSKRIFSDSLLCTAMSPYDKQYAQLCSNIIMDTYFKCNDIRRFGSCAIELCYLAEGKCELFFEYKVMPWDYAAGYLILSEAGGVITNEKGVNPDVKPTMLIGANSMDNYNELLSIVNKYLTKYNHES